MSVAANLSTTYTNRCVRITTIVNWKLAEFDDRKICAVSGHKSVQSLNAYDRPTSNDMKALAKAVDKDNVSSLWPTSEGNPISILDSLQQLLPQLAILSILDILQQLLS